jgi:hypothetical protein
VKKTIVTLVIILLVYLGLFFHLSTRYNNYSNMHPFGLKDNYILHAYYELNGSFPSRSDELKEFIVEHDSLFINNDMAKYLRKYDFHILQRRNRYYVYINGFNYVNDSLKNIVKISDINIFNYLSNNGDIVLFSSDDNYSRPVIITQEILDKFPKEDEIIYPDNYIKIDTLGK